jgi:hypothetical protein
MLDGERCIRCREYYKFEELGVAPGGFSICQPCADRIDPAKEKPRACPVDWAQMRKEFVRELILIDKCSACGGARVDGNELEVIERAANANANFAVGLLLGIAIG